MPPVDVGETRPGLLVGVTAPDVLEELVSPYSGLLVPVGVTVPPVETCAR